MTVCFFYSIWRFQTWQSRHFFSYFEILLPWWYWPHFQSRTCPVSLWTLWSSTRRAGQTKKRSQEVPGTPGLPIYIASRAYIASDPKTFDLRRSQAERHHYIMVPLKAFSLNVEQFWLNVQSSYSNICTYGYHFTRTCNTASEWWYSSSNDM